MAKGSASSATIHGLYIGHPQSPEISGVSAVDKTVGRVHGESGEWPKNAGKAKSRGWERNLNLL